MLLFMLTLLTVFPAAPTPAAADSPAVTYRVVTAAGDSSSLEAVLDALAGADVLFLGEEHDDSTAHALQLRLLEDAFARFGADSGRSVVLALEMFERDVQPVLDEYLAGWIRERDFLAAARPWSNYATDYRPLVEFARAHGVPVVASNAPARYVSRVGREGPGSLDTLGPAAHAWLPPRPVAPASPALADAFRRAMQEMMAEMTPPPDSTVPDTLASPADSLAPPPDTPATPPIHGSSYLLDAQNLRDAAMAHTVARALDAHPGALVLHVNGRFHSDDRLGIPEHLVRYRPGTHAVVVTFTSEPDFDPATMDDAGDFVVLTAPGLQ